MLTRRNILAGSALGALVGCTETTTNGVTTITLNVASVAAWGQAFVNGATMIAALIPAAAPVAAFGPLLSADLQAFNTATGGQLSLTFNSNSVPAAVSSLLGDAQKLATAAGSALTGAPAAALAEAQQDVGALNTLLSIFQAAMGSTVAAAPLNGMTEAAALQRLGVSR